MQVSIWLPERTIKHHKGRIQKKKINAIALVVIKGLEIPYLRSFLTRQTKLRCPHAVMFHSHPHDIRAK